jgi:hypothetical protein
MITIYKPLPSPHLWVVICCEPLKIWRRTFQVKRGRWPIFHTSSLPKLMNISRQLTNHFLRQYILSVLASNTCYVKGRIIDDLKEAQGICSKLDPKNVYVILGMEKKFSP